jgi:hypothetical protein
VGAISWGGRIFGASDLFSAAREARAHQWLSDPARKFLYHVGICLATDRPVSERQMEFLGRLLHRLRRKGSTVFADVPRRGASWSEGDLEALEQDIAAMRFFLASATERVEGYWERLQRLKRRLRH